MFISSSEKQITSITPILTDCPPTPNTHVLVSITLVEDFSLYKPLHELSPHTVADVSTSWPQQLSLMAFYIVLQLHQFPCADPN